MKKWITNVFENEVLTYITAYATEGRTLTVGEPSPSDYVNVERMKALQLVGLYEEVAEIKLENIRTEYVNDGFSLVFEFTGHTESVWFYKGMSTKGVVNQLAGFVKSFEKRS